MRKDMLGYNMMDELMGGLMNPIRTPLMMRADIIETKDAFLFFMDIPGVKKDDIKISFEDGVMTVAADKKAMEDIDGEYLMRERAVCTCKRSFRLPANVKPENIKAKYDDGVLKVTVEKPEESKPANITIG